MMMSGHIMSTMTICHKTRMINTNSAKKKGAECMREENDTLKKFYELLETPNRTEKETKELFKMITAYCYIFECAFRDYD